MKFAARLREYKTLSDGCKEQLRSRASTLRNNYDLCCVSSLFSNLPVLHVYLLHLYSCPAAGLHACVFPLSSAICHAACAAHMYGFVLLPICLLLSLAARTLWYTIHHLHLFCSIQHVISTHF